MTTAFVHDQRVSSPLKTKARMIGLVYLLTVVFGAVAQSFVSDKLIQLQDASLTATNILTNGQLFQLGYALYMIEMICQIGMIVLFYDLLKSVNRRLSLLALFIGLAGAVIKIISRIFYIAPLFILQDAPFLAGFSMEQIEAISLMLLKVNDTGAGMALIFLGVFTLLKGILILNSTFLPRFLGVLDLIGGMGWLSFLYAPVAGVLFPYLLMIGFVGALCQIGWLLIVGVTGVREMGE